MKYDSRLKINIESYFQLNDTFRDIQRKLYEKASSVEDLAEHREWMKSVPELLDDKKVN